MNTLQNVECYLTQSERLALCDGRALPVILSPASIGQDERPLVTLSTPRFPLGMRPARVGEGILHGYGRTVGVIEEGTECEEMHDDSSEIERAMAGEARGYKGNDKREHIARAYELPSYGFGTVSSELKRMGMEWND